MILVPSPEKRLNTDRQNIVNSANRKYFSERKDQNLTARQKYDIKIDKIEMARLRKSVQNLPVTFINGEPSVVMPKYKKAIEFNFD